MTRDQFADLALRHLGELTAYARRLTRSAADADDLLQSTYEHAFRRWKTLRSPAGCRAWLFQIARNIAIDQYRSSTARPELRLVNESEREMPQISLREDDRIQLLDLEQALARLPNDQVEAILLSDLWGFRYEEIAEITGCAAGTVGSRIFRGRWRLLKLLAPALKAGRRKDFRP